PSSLATSNTLLDRERMATSAPCSFSPCAMARPSPTGLPAPVTSAFFPARLNKSIRAYPLRQNAASLARNQEHSRLCTCRIAKQRRYYHRWTAPAQRSVTRKALKRRRGRYARVRAMRQLTRRGQGAEGARYLASQEPRENG